MSKRNFTKLASLPLPHVTINIIIFWLFRAKVWCTYDNEVSADRVDGAFVSRFEERVSPLFQTTLIPLLYTTAVCPMGPQMSQNQTYVSVVNLDSSLGRETSWLVPRRRDLRANISSSRNLRSTSESVQLLLTPARSSSRSSVVQGRLFYCHRLKNAWTSQHPSTSYCERTHSTGLIGLRVHREVRPGSVRESV